VFAGVSVMRSIVKEVLYDRDAVRRTLKLGNDVYKSAGDW
jgi:hypothetical protein